MVEVMVDMDDAGNRGEAFARALADAVSGAVLDEGEQVWPPAAAPAQAVRGESDSARSLKLAWFGRWRPGDVPLPALLVGQAERWLPEALPSQYGIGKVFQTEYAGGGVDGMVRAWQSPRATSLDFSSAPMAVGDMTTKAGIAEFQGMWRLTLRCLEVDFAAAEPRRRLRAFFTGVADGGSAEYATAEVLHFEARSDSRLPFKLDPGRAVSFWLDWPEVWQGQLGLTPYPTWWSWFGPSYLPLVQERLDRAPARWRVTSTGRGTLLELADKPAGAWELRGPVARLLGLDWMPSQLRVRGRYGLRSARVLPDWRSGG
jgi:hypothetical protein